MSDLLYGFGGCQGNSRSAGLDRGASGDPQGPKGGASYRPPCDHAELIRKRRQHNRARFQETQRVDVHQ